MRDTDAVAVLFAASGSVTLEGSVTLAVFAIVVGEPAAGVPFTVKTTRPPAAMSTTWSTAPVPLAAQVPETAAQVHVTPLRFAGTASCTRAPLTASGPLFATVTVKTSGWPITKVLPLAVFVNARSARADTVVEAVAVLLARFGSEVAEPTEAAFTWVPGAAAVTTTWIGALAPLASVGVEHVTTLPASAHDQPAPAAETKVTPAGSVSVTTTFDAASGPLFVVVTV